MANTEKLLEILVTIAQDLKSHDQQMWGRLKWDKEGTPVAEAACGTTYCLAGHTVTQAGYKPVWEHVVGEDNDTPTYGMTAVEWNDVNPLDPVSGEIRETMGIEVVARTILDFNQVECDAFFYEAKTFGDLMVGYQALVNNEDPSAAIEKNKAKRFKLERAIVDWLAVERQWKYDVKAWLSAENHYKASVLYKEAEQHAYLVEHLTAEAEELREQADAINAIEVE